MMQPLTQTEFTALIAEGEIVQTGKRGPRLIEGPNQLMIKFFPRRKCISSTLLMPYAKRFIKNAKRLLSLNIQAPVPICYGKIQGTRTYYVKYPKIVGQDIRDYLSSTSDRHVLARIAVFVAKLHELGIFFRGIHLGNILQQPEGDFVLIDIAVVKFKHKPLSIHYRRRNLQHLFAYPDDQTRFLQFGLSQFIDCYLDASLLSPRERQRLRDSLGELAC